MFGAKCRMQLHWSGLGAKGTQLSSSLVEIGFWVSRSQMVTIRSTWAEIMFPLAASKSLLTNGTSEAKLAYLVLVVGSIMVMWFFWRTLKWCLFVRSSYMFPNSARLSLISFRESSVLMQSWPFFWEILESSEIGKKNNCGLLKYTYIYFRFWDLLNWFIRPSLVWTCNSHSLSITAKLLPVEYQSYSPVKYWSGSRSMAEAHSLTMRRCTFSGYLDLTRFTLRFSNI